MPKNTLKKPTPKDNLETNVKGPSKPIQPKKEEKEKKKRRLLFFWFWLLRPENKVPFIATAIGSTVVAAAAGTFIVLSNRPSPINSTPIYVVSFNAMGGTEVDNQSVVENGLVTLPTSTKLGFDLSGWFESNDNGDSFIREWNFSTDQVVGNMTLFAQWQPGTYTIAFDTQGGSAISSISGLSGTLVSGPMNPTKEGYTFDGWFADEQRTIPATIVTSIGTESITYYAKWTANVYSLTYMSVNNVLMSAIYAGVENTVALTQDGKLYGWGVNGGKFLGGANIINTPVLIQPNLPDGQTIQQIFLSGAGMGGLFVITNQNRLYAWGGNGDGSLGLGDTLTPKLVNEVVLPGLANGEFVAKVSSNGGHTLFLTNQHRLFVVGRNNYRQLGDGTNINKATPFVLPLSLEPNETIQQVYAGPFSSYVLTNQSRVFSWGYNFDGRLGVGDLVDRNIPTLVTLPSLNNGETITQLSVSFGHASVLTSEGRIINWGSNAYGELGINSITMTFPTPAFLDTSFLVAGDKPKLLSNGDGFSFIVTQANRIYSVGRNNNGRSGNGLGTNTNTRVFSLITVNNYDVTDEIVSISSSNAHTFFLTEQGKIYGWGQNVLGQMGIGNNVDRLVGDRTRLGTSETLKVENNAVDSTLVAFTPVREGYTFGGWYTDEALTIAFDQLTMPASNTTLYAKWEMNS